MNMLKKLLVVFAAMTMSSLAMAQPANPAPAPLTKEVAAPVVATPAAATAAPAADTAAPTEAAPKSMDGSLPGYTPMRPNYEDSVGMPKPKEVDFQEQFTENGQYAKWINNAILLPIITIISLFVLGLLLWVIVRFNRRANPVPSKTTHNTFIEVVWTLVPVLILLGIAYPSLDLLAKQFKPAPAEAVTIKATGYQWYWGYTYPDHGGFEVISNMLKEEGDVAKGERFRTENDGPKLLAVDNRMVVPAGVPLRIQTTAADVIHAFAVPSLWFKLDAVPGRLNEKSITITKPGVYFGQCSELCGARHAFMPLVVEALPPAQFAAWVKAQGGSMPGEEKPAPAAPAAAATPTETVAAPPAAPTN
ncbi:MAG: cytochrome c oxidase subunit II [Sphingomonadaceae bacterium]|jgi:cytochrome c oxidase subunit 2|uniref:cytochrome c oxidase subunit II n=1 Tax=Sphingorhabdus sp. TaxID=1902408 RepID=UPI002FD91CB3|nr:cytochrome c oxidase subunit II [Sphingomonadaceae bacterium]